jgi:ribosome-binding factor A
MSHRREQLASDLRRAVQAAIDRGLNDPRISGMITVTEVHVTQDLKTAHISVSVLPADRQDLTMHGLRSAAGHLRRQIGSGMRVRSMPQLVFALDDRSKKQAAVLGAIARASAATPQKGKESAEQSRERETEAHEGTRDAYAHNRPPEDRSS